MRVYVESYGCTQNLGEGHALERAARAAGHEIVRAPGAADVGVLVTCGVIGPTESRMVRRYRALLSSVPRVVVTGCLVPLRAELFTGPAPDRTLLVPTREQSKLPELLHQWSRVTTVEPPRPAQVGPVEPPEDPSIAEIVLAQGCTSQCTYCYSRLARGHLRSQGRESLLAEVDAASRWGAREVRLSSLDTACWGEDRTDDYRLTELMGEIARLPGDFTVRMGMMSPQSLRPFADRYFDALADERFFRFLHLPVQSGSDEVLAAMRRGYTVDDFRRIVAAGRRRNPDLMLSTDVLVGFPTESDSDFDRTLALVEEIGPEIVNVTRFSPRPMTPAQRLPGLPSGTLKRRSRAMTELRTRTGRHRLERYIGRTTTAVIVERGPRRTSIARMPNYLPVVLSDPWPLGSRTEVRIDGARSSYLLGAPTGGSAGVAKPRDASPGDFHPLPVVGNRTG